MAANGRIPTSQLAALPVNFSNKRKTEHLTSAAYASLVRMMLRAVADTNTNFSVWSAYRSFDAQVAMLKLNYTRVSRGRSLSSDRSYGGSTWAKKPGRPLTASPGYSNHGNGLAVDIHPGPIQTWLKANAGRFGWVNDVPSEPWHYSYLNPGRDQFRSEGLPDVKGMQEKLGIEADGKPGKGFVAAVKAFQKANGLDVDGKAGPDTVKAILGGKGSSAPAPSAPTPESPSVEETVLKLPKLPEVDRSKTSPNSHRDRIDPRDGATYKVKHITVHWWGKPSGQAFDGIVSHLCNKAAEVSAHYVISAGRVAQLVDEKDSSWANGNRVANFESITIECDPNDVIGTLPILAALIADIWGRHGDLPVYPHSHWTSTICCGDYEPHLDAVDQLARTGKTIINTSPSRLPGTVDVDGRWGRETTTELQGRLMVAQDGMAGPDTLKALARYLGAPYVDGKISRQPQGALDLGNGYRKDLIEVGDGDSPLVRLWQAYVGATIDGRLGEETIRRTQIQLNASPASFTRDHAETVKLRTKGALSSAPSTPAPSKGKKVDEDGRFGRETSSEIQRRIGSTVDGRICEDGWTKLAKLYGTPADGAVSHQSYKAEEIGNGIVPRCWRFTGRGSKGSKLIAAIQRDVGVKADGVLFEGTTLAIQKKLNADDAWLRG